MGTRQRQPGTAVLILILLAMVGCSSEPEGPMDAGVSPFYPGPSASSKAAAKTETAAGPTVATKAASPVAADQPGPDAAGSQEADEPLRPENVEKQLRIAVSTAMKGDTSKAVTSLDRILKFEPTNREALLNRAALALIQSEKATAPADRAAAMEKAASMIRTLRRAYEKPTQPEISMFARVLFNEARLYAEQGRFDRASAVLKEGYDGGLDAFERIDLDPKMASLSASKEYRTMVKAIDDANLAAARARVKDYVAKPLDIPFDFKVAGLDGKPFTLDQFKGKVVVIDIWGTWCDPCRKAIPGLIQLYRRHHRLGLEVVGLAFERDAPNPEVATQLVKKCIEEMGIPYPCAVGDESIIAKIPNFHAFPTTIVLDRQGRVRMLVLDNNEGLLGALDNVTQVLAAEPATPSPAPAKPATTAPPAAAKPAEAKPADATKKVESKPR